MTTFCKATAACSIAAALALLGCTGIDMGGTVMSAGPKRSTVLGDFETKADMNAWKGSLRWGRTGEGSIGSTANHATLGQRAMVIEVPAGRGASVTLSDLPRNWKPYESLAFDVYTPAVAGRAEWVPFTLLVENSQSADWFGRLHHDSRLGVVAGRRTTIEVPLREIKAYNSRRRKKGVGDGTGGFDGIESPLGMLSGPFDISTVTQLELRFSGVGADRTFYVDNVRLVTLPNFDGMIAKTPASTRVGSPYGFVSFDGNKGGALCDVLGDRAGIEFRYKRGRHEWYSSAAGSNHARIKVLEKSANRLRLKVTGGFFGPSPKPHVDLESEATFEYTIEQARGERFPTVRIDATFKRTGAALKGITEFDLVWKCGRQPVADGTVMAAAKWMRATSFEAGSKLGYSKRWLMLSAPAEIHAAYNPSFNSGHELTIPIPVAKGGAVAKDTEWKGTFFLQSNR